MGVSWAQDELIYHSGDVGGYCDGGRGDVSAEYLTKVFGSFGGVAGSWERNFQHVHDGWVDIRPYGGMELILGDENTQADPKRSRYVTRTAGKATHTQQLHQTDCSEGLYE
jgi:hypothetical protein